MTKDLSNHEIVTLAVYLLGGESRVIDTEDIAVKANQIAPGRFTWRKYSNQINIENVRTFLSDAKKGKNGSYLTGSGKDGWMLTQSGVRFASKNVGSLNGIDLSKKRLNPKERQWLQNERARMLSSDAYLKFNSGGLNTVSVKEAEAFFRLDDYVVGATRERKVLRILNSFGNDPELGQVVKELADKIQKR